MIYSLSRSARNQARLESRILLADIIVRPFSDVDREVYNPAKNLTTATPSEQQGEQKMSIDIATIPELLNFNRVMTLKLLDEIGELPDPASALGHRPGPQRAHIAWQIMHLGITEELFASQRLRTTDSSLTEWFDLYQKGSTASDELPTIDTIRSVLSESRKNLLDAISQITEADLDTIPAGLSERGWTNQMALQIVCWHEPHHQGQAHLLLNSWKSQQ
ncbi:DinB superfamily protein [Gimesia panareensis]|nr:DinB superfamily protein [Gimesia panareensis]